jgi:hypothetical protein
VGRVRGVRVGERSGRVVEREGVREGAGEREVRERRGVREK